jgi:colicin import membrane protein
VNPTIALSPSLRSISFAAMLAVAFALTGCAQTSARVHEAFQATPGAALVEHYPPGSIKSVAVADQVLSEVGNERTRIEAHYAAEQTACYPKFFTTSCMDNAKEQRRYALAQIRPVEIQAEVFKRRDRVEQRDKALAEKRAEVEAEAPQRAKEAKEREIASAKKATDSARRVEQAAEANRNATAPEAGNAAKNENATAERAAPTPSPRRQPRPRETLSDEQRAANIEAYEKKARDAKARQEEIARKKAEKERELAAKRAAPAAP